MLLISNICQTSGRICHITAELIKLENGNIQQQPKQKHKDTPTERLKSSTTELFRIFPLNKILLEEFSCDKI